MFTRRSGSAAIGFLLLFAASPAQAFDWMVRHGYTGCTMCHADPSGAGLLTTYGRALAETTLRTQWGKSNQDGEPGRIAGFLFGAVKLPERLLAQVDVRGLTVVPISPKGSAHTYLMQADAAAQLKVSRVRVQGSLGYAKEGAVGAAVTRGDANGQNRLIARTYWAGVGSTAISNGCCAPDA